VDRVISAETKVDYYSAYLKDLTMDEAYYVGVVVFTFTRGIYRLPARSDFF